MPTPPFPSQLGEPVSDKSGLVAGFLQLFFGCFGAGRFYLGSTSIALLQLYVGVFGVLATMFCFGGPPFLLGAVIWGVVDAFLIFTGSVKDEYGRTLRT